MPEPAARAFDCIEYASCLNRAVAADLPFPCPCGRYCKDPAAVRWRDVAACQHLILAALLPEVFEVFQALRAARDNGEKWRILSRAAPTLGLRKRDMLR